MRICWKCKKEKEDSLFKTNKTRSSQIETFCKECDNEKSREYYLRNKERINLRHQRYNALHLTKEYHYKQYLKLKDKAPEKYKARYTLKNAVYSGKVKKENCKICGSEKSQAHHPDYSKPLEVIWLCVKHHREEHYKLNLINSKK